jgi:hypothetical protein
MPMDAMDYEEIRSLLARYNLSIDSGEAKEWAACFTPDGVFECTGAPEDSPFGGRHEGTTALEAYATGFHAASKGRARHWNANLDIEGDGQEATMRCYLLSVSVRGPGALKGSSGAYRDRLRKVDGAWLFTERHIVVDN